MRAKTVQVLNHYCQATGIKIAAAKRMVKNVSWKEKDKILREMESATVAIWKLHSRD